MAVEIPFFHFPKCPSRTLLTTSTFPSFQLGSLFTMRFFSQSFLYECVSVSLTCLFSLTPFFSDPWPIVSLAFFLRYPNPYASHVIACDVISRDFTPSGSLLTTRLILKKATLPRWAPKGIISRSESWILEESEVDPHGKVVRCLTRNLEHVKAMQVHETQTFRQVVEGCVNNFSVTTLIALIHGFKGKPCRRRKLELFQGLDGASRNRSRTMVLLVSERTCRGCVISTGSHPRYSGVSCSRAKELPSFSTSSVRVVGSPCQ